MQWTYLINNMEEYIEWLLRKVVGLSQDATMLVIRILKSVIQSLDGMELDGSGKKEIAINILDEVLDSLFDKDIPRWASSVIIDIMVALLRMAQDGIKDENGDQLPPIIDETPKPAPPSAEPKPQPEPEPEPPITSIYTNWEPFPIPDDSELYDRGYEEGDIVYKNIFGTQWLVERPSTPRPYQSVWVRSIGS